MMRGDRGARLEKHHRVQFLDEAIEAAVRLSHRYIPARQLPDKAVSLIDTACARVAVSQHAVPAEVDDRRRRIQALETELEILGARPPSASTMRPHWPNCDETLRSGGAQLAELEKHWNEEKAWSTKFSISARKLRASGIGRSRLLLERR